MPDSTPSGTVVLVMDMQNGIVARYADSSPILERVGQVLRVARGAGLPIIYVRVQFRAGYPEVSASNGMFGSVKREGKLFQAGSPETEIHPDVAPQAGEWVIEKVRVSAFAGSPLEMILRGLEAEHLVLCGVATSGVVLSTTREAADKDYRLTILSDACADADEEVHRVLTTKIFPRQAQVLTVEAWEKSLAQ